MRAVLTRVRSASVEIEGQIHGRIEQGFLVLLGVHTEDTERERYFYCTHQPDAAGAGLTEFLVTGDANDYSNWVKPGRTWNSNGIEIDEE